MATKSTPTFRRNGMFIFLNIVALINFVIGFIEGLANEHWAEGSFYLLIAFIGLYIADQVNTA